MDRWLLGGAVLLQAWIAQAAVVSDVRVWDEPELTRVVFDLSAEVRHKAFTLDGPERAVIDIQGVAELPRGAASAAGLVRQVRFGLHDKALRVVLDLERSAKPRSYLLAPSGDSGYRLVVELPHPLNTQEPARPAIALADKDIVIAIDAGHGGEDPGATGPTGVREKDVALQIARRLKRLIDAEPGMRAILTREGDYFLPLRQRRMIAQQKRADLFVSIHADAFSNRNVHGSSVYILSPRGASSEHARVLASRENAADLIGGVDIQDKDELLASVLLDISQSAAIDASRDLAARMLGELKVLGPLHKDSVQRAGFAVLKAPDVPSILVETAFISNRKEEARLRDPQQQERLALGMRNGILSYFETYRPQRVVAQAGR